MTQSKNPLKFICLGMGAIGTYIGGSLAASGCEVTFIETPGGFRDRATDLRIRKPGGDIYVPNIKITSDLDALLSQKKFDVALLAIKAFDTSGFIQNLQRFSGKFPTILCLQNGVENESLIEEKLGKGSVLGASITSAVRRIELGDVQLEKLRGVAIQNDNLLGEELVDVFNQAGLNATGYKDRDSMKWSKMLTNLQVNATSAILNWSPAEVLGNPFTYKIEVLQLKEALAVMDRLGLEIVDLPGTPVRLLIKALTILPVGLGRYLIGAPLSKARGKKMPSLQIDLIASRERSEVEFLNGAVTRIGAKVQIPTPVNRVLTETLVNLANGTLKKENFFNKPESLMTRIEDSL